MSSDVRQTAGNARVPRNYWTILEAIRGADPGQHLTAHDVFDRARRVAPTIGFATVHRGLTRLHELGYVLKVDVPGAASAVFEPAVSPHAHFRCLVCGGISDINFRVPDEQIAALAATLGLEIAAESTTFAGRCPRCTQSAARGEAEPTRAGL